MEDGPIFVGGPDRCGKTLLRLALSAHPRLAMTRRTYMWTYFYNRYGDLSQRDSFELCLAAMLRHAPIAALAPDPERIRREFWQDDPTYARLFALVHQHYAQRLGKPRWGEQVGAIEQHADAIFAAYPNARLIHMIRDPRDRFAAMRSTAGAESHAGSAIARWRHSVRLARRNIQRHADRYLIVRYETLVAQREATLREICDFLGEPFVPAMLTLEGAISFGSEERLARRSRRAALNAGETPDLLARRELAFIQSYARREMLAYGYSLQPLQLSLADRLVLACVDWPSNLAHIAAWHGLEALQAIFPAHIARKQLIVRAR